MNKIKKLFLFLLLGLVFCFSAVNAETEPNNIELDVESEKINTNSYIEDSFKSSYKALGISDALISGQSYVGSNIPANLRDKNMIAYVFAYINPKFGSGVHNDNSLPAPFNVYHCNSDTGSQTFYVGAWNGDDGKKHATSIYCTGYRVPLVTGHSIPSKGSDGQVYGWDGKPFNDETKRNITYALIFGYNTDVSTSTQYQDAAIIVRNGKSDLTGERFDGNWVNMHVIETFSTQVAVWLAATNQFDTAYTDAIMRHFFALDGDLGNWNSSTAYNQCKEIVTNLKKASKMPSYSNKEASNAPVHELAWNAANSRFEKVLFDDYGINSADRIRLEHNLAGTGLSIDYSENNDTAVLWTKTAVGTPQNPVTCSVKKIINENMGVAGFWQSDTANGGKPNQPMTKLLNEPREPEVAYYKAYTKGFKVRIHKTLQSTTGNLGDATPRNAVYGIYSDSACNNEVARVTIGDNGYSNKTDYINYQTYYAKEISSSDSTVKDETVYTIDPATASTDEDGDFGLTLEVSDWVNESIIYITKTLGETGYDPEISLEGVVFKVTLDSDPNQVYYTNKSGTDGICSVKNVPFGRYTVSEVEYPSSALKVADFPINVTEHGKTYESKQVDPSKEMQIEIKKKLIDISVGRTDATVEGACFTIYTDPECKTPYVDKNGNTVIVGPTDNAGHAISKTMRTGNYYAKETTFPKGIDPDAVIPGDTVTYRNKVYTFLADNTMQQNALQIVSKTVYNKPITGKVIVRKMDKNTKPTQASPAEGALLRLTLKKSIGTDNVIQYDARVQRDGTATFVFEEMADLGYDPNILYGKYVLSEVEPSSNGKSYFYFIDAESIKVDIQNETEYRIVSDDHVPVFLEIVKKDADTSKTVELSGFKYKIYRLASKTLEAGWVSQFDSETNTYIDEFVSDKNGHVLTPDTLEAGEYIIYETEAPKGYFIDPRLRVPEESKLGDKSTGVYKNITKVATGLAPNASPSSQEGDLKYTAEVVNEPLVGKIEIEKKGLMFTEVSETETEFGELYKAHYKEQGIANVVYDIYTAEDIKYPDEKGNYYQKGIKVGSITTQSNGIGLSEELYPGKYELVEVSAPAGIVVTGERIPVEVVNNDKYNRVSINHYDLTNNKQKLQIEINKRFEESPYNVDNENTRKAIFGVYTKEEIPNYNNTLSIPADKLVALVEFDGNGQKCDEMDLPSGKYYVKELYVSEGYELSKEVKEVTLTPDTTSTPVLTFDGGSYINTPITRTLYLLKFSASSFANADKFGLTGTKIDENLVNTELDSFISEINSLTIDEVKEKVAQKQWLIVGGAEFTIYLDKECTKPLLYDGTNEPVVITSDDLSDGFYEKENLPLGTYYIKETKTPVYTDGLKEIPYIADKEPVKIELKEEENLAGNIALRALWNESTAGVVMRKMDAFTSDPVAKCTFEILDSTKKVIYHSTTDEKGEAGIPMDIIHQGETYYFHEIEAPDLYKEKGEVLNTDYHEFVANYEIVDGKVVFDEVKEIVNSRFARDVKVKKIDEETGKPLPGCKFSIVLLDEKGNEYVNKDGKTIYAVKDAVTDENGECLIEQVPAGSYRFIEVEAPEGYDLAEQKLEGLEFIINKDTPKVLEFEVTNTGDIAVYVLSAVAVISILGIVFVVSRKRKLVR